VDVDAVADVCDRLGLRFGSPYNGKYGHQVSIACPLAPFTHDDPDDRNKSCSVLLDEDGPSYVRCHSANCDFKGNFFNLIQKLVRLHRKAPQSLLALLAEVAELDKDSIEHRVARLTDKVTVKVEGKRRVVPMRPFDRDVLEEEVFQPFAGLLPQYAANRGVSVEAATRWRLGYDQPNGRLVFSVRRHDGALVGMTGRIIPSVEAVMRAKGFEPTKYHNYSGLNKGRYLYGTHTWVKGLPVVLVEGPLDAVRTWMALKDRANVGATLGEGFSPEHRRMINSAWPPEIYIFSDGDTAGRRMATKIHDHLHDLCINRLMRCPVISGIDDDGIPYEYSTDPGAMSDGEINYAFETADVILKEIRWV
jgi:hypothetical protein